MEEIWKDIQNYKGLYKVSNLGRVKSLFYNNKVLKGNNSVGYLSVALYKNKERFSVKVHRLVAQAFISNPENKCCVNHINGNREDNRVENLEWVTNLENIIHSYKDERRKNDQEKKIISFIRRYNKHNFILIEDFVNYLQLRIKESHDE